MAGFIDRHFALSRHIFRFLFIDIDGPDEPTSGIHKFYATRLATDSAELRARGIAAAEFDSHPFKTRRSFNLGHRRQV